MSDLDAISQKRRPWEGLIPKGIASLRQHDCALEVILNAHALHHPTSHHAPSFLQH